MSCQNDASLRHKISVSNCMQSYRGLTTENTCTNFPMQFLQSFWVFGHHSVLLCNNSSQTAVKYYFLMHAVLVLFEMRLFQNLNSSLLDRTFIITLILLKCFWKGLKKQNHPSFNLCNFVYFGSVPELCGPHRWEKALPTLFWSYKCF